MYNKTVNRVATPAYARWKGMFDRCVNRYNKWPAYVGCKVSGNFLDFQFFAHWCHQQIGFDKSWDLDKDLLIKGNKEYNENTCIFLPPELNLLLTKNQINRGEFPIGVCRVSKSTSRYRAMVKMKGRKIQLGSFNNTTDAFLCYKYWKEAYIKVTAEEYKELIDPRAYEALLKYEVHITD